MAFSVRKSWSCQKRVKMVVPIAISSLLRQLYGGIILAEYYSKLSIFIHLVTRDRSAVNPPGRVLVEGAARQLQRDEVRLLSLISLAGYIFTVSDSNKL